MKKDEFNVEKITNEGKNPDFEFGNTPSEESTSYLDNSDLLRDEINDNPTSNEYKRVKKERRREERKDKSSKEEGTESGASSSSGTSGASGATGGLSTAVVTVAGASLIAVTTLSTLVGINLFFNAKCQMNSIESSSNMIAYYLDLVDINDDKCIIRLENDTYDVSQPLFEGSNSGEFTDLTPLTDYYISVIDVTYNNFVLYSETITTMEEEHVGATYTVTFISNGGSEIDPQTIDEGGMVSQPDDPIREDYIFGGWFSNMDLTEEFSFDTPINSDLTLYAKWTQIATYIVTFESNGGSEVSEQEIKEGGTVTRPDDPSKEECEFIGWFTDADLTNEYDFETPVTDDFTLYAKWEELPKVTISFDANGGEGEQEPGYAYIDEEFILPDCTFTGASGYVFDYWQLEGTEQTYNPGEGYVIVNEDPVVFVAVWVQAATIEFYPGIGAQGSVTSIKYAVGKEYEIPSGEEYFIAPTNQEFDYWFDDMYSEQRHAGDVITIEDTYYSFTAHWKYLDGLTFTVTFDSNGGSEVESQVVNAGTNAIKPDDPTKDDYIFEGWYSNSELTSSYNFITPVTEDITLYAKWSTTYSVSGEGFNGFPNSTVDYATESEINGVTLQVSAYSCYFNDPDDGHGLWIPLGYDSQSPEDYISYLANKTPINGSIKNIAITVGPSAYDGTSNTTLHVTFGTEPMLEHLTSGTTITYDTDATLVVECNLDGSSYFNITNVSENGLVIESIVVTYYVN